MKFEIDFLTTQTILSIILAMTRVSGLFLVAPIFSRDVIPSTVKIGMTAVFSFFFYESIFTNAHNLILTDPYQLVIGFLHEIVIGLILGFLINLVIDAIISLAHLVGIQMGESASNIFNPAISGSTNPIGLVYLNISMLFFVSFNGLFHVAYILRKSFEIIPLASYSVDMQALALNYKDVFSEIFITGVKFMLPLITLMFIVDIFVALFAKIMPQANMYFLMMPNKLILGMLIIAMTLGAYYIALENFFIDEIYEIFDLLFK